MSDLEKPNEDQLDRPLVRVSGGVSPAGEDTRSQDASEVFEEYLSIIRRRKWLIAVVTAASVLFAVVITLLTKPVFRASAKLLFSPTPSRFSLLESAPNRPPALGTQVELLQGAETARLTSKVLHRDDGRDVSPGEVQRSLSAAILEDTDLVRLDVLRDNAGEAALIANAVARAYIERNDERIKKGSRDTADYIAKQLEVAKNELLSGEEELRRYKEGHGVGAISEETVKQLDHLSALETAAAQVAVDLRETEQRAAEHRRRLQAQKANLAAGNPIRDNDLIRSLQAKLVTLESDLAVARQKYTDRYPGVIPDLERQVAQTKAQLNRELTAILQGASGTLSAHEEEASALSRYQTDEIALQARQQAIAGLLAEQRGHLSALPATELDLARLTRRTQTAAKIYTGLLERSQEARINQVMQVGDVELGEPAIPPFAPIRPKPALNLAFGLICGLALGLGAAFFIEYMDDTVKSPTLAVRTVGAPVLGIIPNAANFDGRSIALSAPTSAATEAYRTLRSNVVFGGLASSVSELLVTSASAEEGKSATAANLAVILAQAGRRVVLVDADLRRPTLHRTFGQERSPGLTDVLVGASSLEGTLRPTEVENLRLLTSGPRPVNPAELLESPRMASLVGDLRGQADVVIFDTAPVVPLADTLSLSTHCRTALLICEAGGVSRRALARAGELLGQARVGLLGVVMNKVDPVRHGGYYYYYYPSYYYGDDRRPVRKRRRRSPPSRASLPSASPSLPTEEKPSDSPSARPES